MVIKGTFPVHLVSEKNIKPYAHTILNYFCDICHLEFPIYTKYIEHFQLDFISYL
jgi:hypothetical protein